MFNMTKWFKMLKLLASILASDARIPAAVHVNQAATVELQVEELP
jgi:hypothetical protein